MTYKTREQKKKESDERQAKWERNRERRKMLTDDEAYQILGTMLRDAGIKSRVYAGPGRTPLAPKKGKVYTVSRSHYLRSTHPCEVEEVHRFTMPGFGSGNSCSAIATGRTWEACVIDLRRHLEKKS